MQNCSNLRVRHEWTGAGNGQITFTYWYSDRWSWWEAEQWTKRYSRHCGSGIPEWRRWHLEDRKPLEEDSRLHCNRQQSSCRQQNAQSPPPSSRLFSIRFPVHIDWHNMYASTRKLLLRWIGKILSTITIIVIKSMWDQTDAHSQVRPSYNNIRAAARVGVDDEAAEDVDPHTLASHVQSRVNLLDVSIQTKHSWNRKATTIYHSRVYAYKSCYHMS